MRLYASIEDGKLAIGPLSSGRRNPAVRISYEERAKLVDYFVILVRTKVWDGHVMCSSSMDFANEDGWPQPEAREYLDQCVLEALELIRRERSN
jgi:hypothetical protein